LIGTFWKFAAKLGLVLSLSYPQVSVAEGLTAKDFLGWGVEAQTGFLHNSVVMAATVSSRRDTQHAGCITAWFFDDRGIRADVRAEVDQTLRDFPEYHPATVLVALIERECGAFWP